MNTPYEPQNERFGPQYYHDQSSFQQTFGLDTFGLHSVKKLSQHLYSVFSVASKAVK